MHPIDFPIVKQPQIMPAQPISRRKKFNYHGNKTKKYPRTNRTEMSVVERAIAVGALTAMRGDYATQRDLARTMGRQQGSLSKLLHRVEAKANNKTCAIWDEILYENDLGRGRSRLLTQKQKEDIIRIATASRSAREKESWQAITHGDFESVVPKMSITTFENVMYEAGFARRRPGWKPHLTDEQEQVRYEWALAHNPDRDEEYDSKGYDFTQVVFTDETPARIGEERGMMRTGVAKKRDGMTTSNMIATARTAAFNFTQLFATTLRDLVTFIAKKQRPRSRRQLLTFSASMLIKRRATTNYRSTHDRHSTASQKVTSTAVTILERSSMCLRRWIIIVAIARAEELMVIDTEKVH